MSDWVDYRSTTTPNAAMKWEARIKGEILEPGRLVKYIWGQRHFLLLITKTTTVGGGDGEDNCVVLAHFGPMTRTYDLGTKHNFAFTKGPVEVLLVL